VDRGFLKFVVIWCAGRIVLMFICLLPIVLEIVV